MVTDWTGNDILIEGLPTDRTHGVDTIETDEGGQEISSQRRNLAYKVRRVWTLDVEVGRGTGPARQTERTTP